MDKKKITTLFKRFRKANPSPTTELVYQTPFELLIAVILSAQATDVSVNKATAKLFKIANSPEKILALGETQLKKYIKTIGLFNAKAKNIIHLAGTLKSERGGKSYKKNVGEFLPSIKGRIIKRIIENNVICLNSFLPKRTAYIKKTIGKIPR